MEFIDVVIKIGQVIVKFANPVARMSAFLGVCSAIYAGASGLIEKMIIAIDSLVVSTGGGTADFRPLAFANFVFPLSETIALLIGWIALYLAAATVRIIKSFIPTVA